MRLLLAALALSAMEPPPHRMSVRRTDDLVIVDDSYNASPAAVSAALALLRGQAGRRVAVIGDMRELGSLSDAAHADAGREAAASADVLVGVGELAGGIVRSARDAGMRGLRCFMSSRNRFISGRVSGIGRGLSVGCGSGACRHRESADQNCDQSSLHRTVPLANVQFSGAAGTSR